MASGPGITVRLGDQQNSGGLSRALLGAEVSAALAGFRIRDDGGVISMAVLYRGVD
jgi:hypothetical protein